MQEGHPYPHPDRKRNAERKHPEHQRLRDVLLQVLQVHFKTCQKHDIIDTHLAEELETAVALQNIETILANHHTGQNHADDVRDAQSAQDNGSKQDDHQHQEENPSGVRNRKMYANIR